jgi:hypothetical protein
MHIPAMDQLDNRNENTKEGGGGSESGQHV